MSMYEFGSFGGGQRLTPSDVTTYNGIKRLLVDGAGTLALVDQAGNSFTMAAVVVGQQIPLQVKQVLATGTTATVIGLS